MFGLKRLISNKVKSKYELSLTGNNVGGPVTAVAVKWIVIVELDMTRFFYFLCQYITYIKTTPCHCFTTFLRLQSAPVPTKRANRIVTHNEKLINSIYLFELLLLHLYVLFFDKLHHHDYCYELSSNL